MHKDRSKAASSMDSFNVGDELASLEDRLKMKLTPSDCLRFVSHMIWDLTCCMNSSYKPSKYCAYTDLGPIKALALRCKASGNSCQNNGSSTNNFCVESEEGT